MQKTAQKRSLLDKIRERTNLGGIATEKWFDPEFKEIMDQLRDMTDDPVRSIISGQPIGRNAPETDGISLKDLLKSARSNFNRREYMKCVADLGRFHKKFYHVVSILEAFEYTLNRVHYRFLFDKVTPGGREYDQEYAQYLQDLRTRFSPPKTASYQSMLLKEAGIMDFLTNIGTTRGRALAAWEKRYPGRVKELKKSLEHLLNNSDKLLANTLLSLKSMAIYRAERQVDDYAKEASKIIRDYKIYDKLFKDFYEKNVKKFLEQQELLVNTEPETTGDTGTSYISSGTPGGTAGGTPGGTPRGTPGVTPGETPSGTSGETQGGTSAPASILSSNVAVNQSSPGMTSELLQEQTRPVVPHGRQRGVVRPEVPSGMTQEELEIARRPRNTPSSPKASPEAIAAANKALREARERQESAMKKLQESVSRKSLKPPPSKPQRSASLHDPFIMSLESLSKEEPIILAKYILKYAKSIEHIDQDSYKTLVNIVKSIKV